jgi:hypothetical protein
MSSVPTNAALILAGDQNMPRFEYKRVHILPWSYLNMQILAHIGRVHMLHIHPGGSTGPVELIIYP